MSDDLIRRNDVLNLLDKIYKQEKDLMRSIWIRNSIKDKIEEIPTAYNIDKVVEELEEEMGCHDHCSYKGAYCSRGNCRWSIIDDVIEIVKAGGKNDSDNINK